MLRGELSRRHDKEGKENATFFSAHLEHDFSKTNSDHTDASE